MLLLLLLLLGIDHMTLRGALQQQQSSTASKGDTTGEVFRKSKIVVGRSEYDLERDLT